MGLSFLQLTLIYNYNRINSQLGNKGFEDRFLAFKYI